MEYIKVDILMIELDSNFVTIQFSVSSARKLRYRDFKFFLNDFDDISIGKIVMDNHKMYDNIDNVIYVDFEITERFEMFKDGILKIIISSETHKDILYYTIYSLENTELYDGDIHEIEDYFQDCNYTDEISKNAELEIKSNQINEKITEVENFEKEKISFEDDSFEEINEFDLWDIDFSEYDDEILEVVEEDEENLNVRQLNEYNDAWLNYIRPSYWVVQKSGSKDEETLDVDFTISYEGITGTILKDFKVYITDINGNKFFADLYFSNTCLFPGELDIWADGETHCIRIAPCFYTSRIGKLRDGTRFTVCFTDVLQKYIVRKTFTMINEIWKYEELVAISL